MTKEEAKKILAEYVKACHEDDAFTLEQFVYEEVIEAMNMGAEAISEHPVSSNLEEAAKEYAYDGDVDGYGVTYAESNGKYFRTEVMNHFIAGAKWQKEQMMQEAVKCEYDQYPAVICLPAPIPRMDKGDKVRIIIVKKD